MNANCPLFRLERNYSFHYSCHEGTRNIAKLLCGLPVDFIILFYDCYSVFGAATEWPVQRWFAISPPITHDVFLSASDCVDELMPKVDTQVFAIN